MDRSGMKNPENIRPADSAVTLWILRCASCFYC
jgi:hypothetical protein